MSKLIASLVCIAAVCAARADYALERGAAKDGLLLTDGVRPGAYHVRLEGFSGDDATTRAKVWHEGRRIEFVRGGPWMDDNGTQRMTLESRPVEVKPGEAFRIDRETPGTRIVLAEKPLDYAPQRVFTNMALDPEVPFAAEADFGSSNVAVTLKSYLGSSVKGRLSVKVTDYYGKTLAEVDRRDVELGRTLKLDVPYEDNGSGQFRAAVDFKDGSGRKVYRVFVRLSDAKTPHRELLRLNEGWQRDSGAKVVMPAEIKEEEERFSCRRLVPASFAGRRVVFKALRVVGEAALFVNGEKAADLAADGNISGEMEADITPLVRIGETNDFLIVAHREGKGVKFRPGRVSAIGELSIEAHGENAVGHVVVVTSFREKAIRVKAEHPVGFKVRNTVWRGDEKLLSFADEAKWEDPPLWGPFEFPLLKLVTELVDEKGNVVDEKLTRFAFREFWADGMALMWNGHRVKGDSRSFVSTWGWHFDRRCKRQFNCDVIWENKLRGVKFLRHIYNSSEFLDFCDEAGIPCAVGCATIANPSPEKTADKEFWAWKEYNDRCLVDTLRNHPSVMTWYITNEYYAESEDRNFAPVKSALRNVRAYDPFHFAEAGCDLDLRGENNIVSTHYPVEMLALRKAGCYMPYSFYWRDVDSDFAPGGAVPFGQVLKVCNVYADSPIKWGEKPIFVNETCWDYFYSPPFGYTRLAGDEVFNDPRFCDKWHIEAEIESVRGHRDADVTLWTPWRWYHVDSEWRVSPEVDVVNIQRYSRFYEGTEVKYDVNVFYDKWRPATITWFWRLEDAEGRTVASSKNEQVSVDTSALLRKRISFKAPPPGRYRLVFGLKGLCEKTLNISVGAKSASVGRRYANVFGAKDQLSERLLDRAASGETIVVLVRDDYPEWLPELPKLADQSAAILRTFRARHPVLSGIAQDDLKYFYPRSIACDRGFAKPSGGNARTILEFGGEKGLDYSALIEVPYGKGCFIYSRLVLEPDVNPVAAKLLGNMAAYKSANESGRALFLTVRGDVRHPIVDALRKNCGAEIDVGGMAEIGKYNAVFVDGKTLLSTEDIKALASSGKNVVVFGACEAAEMKTRPVGAKSWSGRAVRVANDPIFDGLTNQDMMWRKKFSDQTTAFAELAAEEFVAEKGVLTYPAYVVRRGNFIFTTLDPTVNQKDVVKQVSRIWATILGNAGVSVGGCARPVRAKKASQDAEYAALTQEERDKLHDQFVAEAMAAKEVGERAKAIALYEKALRAKPVDLGIYRSIGALYEEAHDWEAALRVYRRSLEADYNQPDLWDEEKRLEAKVKGKAK